jgi:PilZ domain
MSIPSNSERRQSARFLCGAWTSGRVLSSGGEEREVLAVFNLSAGGVRLVLRNHFDPDTVESVRLTHSLRDFECQVPMKVVYVEPYPNGHFILGGSFTRELTFTEVQELV